MSDQVNYNKYGMPLTYSMAGKNGKGILINQLYMTMFTVWSTQHRSSF